MYYVWLTVSLTNNKFKVCTASINKYIYVSTQYELTTNLLD